MTKPHPNDHDLSLLFEDGRITRGTYEGYAYGGRLLHPSEAEIRKAQGNQSLVRVSETAYFLDGVCISRPAAERRGFRLPFDQAFVYCGDLL